MDDSSEEKRYGSYEDCRMLHLKLTAAMLILERLGFHVCGSDRVEFMKEVEKIRKEWDEGLAESRERLKRMFNK